MCKEYENMQEVQSSFGPARRYVVWGCLLQIPARLIVELAAGHWSKRALERTLNKAYFQRLRGWHIAISGQSVHQVATLEINYVCHGQSNATYQKSTRVPGRDSLGE